MIEKALLVPVERGTTGRSGQARAAARFVPSPPITTTTAQSAARMAATAATVSSSVNVRSMSIHDNSTSRIVSVALRMMRCESWWTMKCRAPASRAPRTTRRTTLALSSTVTLPAAATDRRTSVPDRGLTTMPMGLDAIRSSTGGTVPVAAAGLRTGHTYVPKGGRRGRCRTRRPG